MFRFSVRRRNRANCGRRVPAYAARRAGATFAGDFPVAAPYDGRMRGPILDATGGQGMSRPITTALDAPARGWRAPHGVDIERTVRSAGRHSRLVRALRILVPGVVVVGGLVLMVMNYFNPLAMLEKLPNVSGKLAVQGSKITMELPRIAGVTRDQRAYELTA